ncbi:MAG: FeoB-associated Cys-rich membrane protein [Lachnospiraceae bacterium]|nr:FeoB-associated Cys-rich membrane protein [Lachnospiraceae bacterium]MBQ9643604.1 FeoB-associated Cys-rich membrane protein [Lachnospiraceae bacterium]
MNSWDLILALAVLAAFIFAVIHCIRIRKRGGSCCGDCGHCTMSCAAKKEETDQ